MVILLLFGEVMEEKDIYKFSKSLNILDITVKRIKNMHIFRYAKFVDTSERGLNCSMAKQSLRFLPEEHDEFLAALKDLQQISNLLHDKYKNEIVDEEERKK